jgi:hypothetical protein
MSYEIMNHEYYRFHKDRLISSSVPIGAIRG